MDRPGLFIVVVLSDGPVGVVVLQRDLASCRASACGRSPSSKRQAPGPELGRYGFVPLPTAAARAPARATSFNADGSAGLGAINVLPRPFLSGTPGFQARDRQPLALGVLLYSHRVRLLKPSPIGPELGFAQLTATDAYALAVDRLEPLPDRLVLVLGELAPKICVFDLGLGVARQLVQSDAEDCNDLSPQCLSRPRPAADARMGHSRTALPCSAAYLHRLLSLEPGAVRLRSLLGCQLAPDADLERRHRHALRLDPAPRTTLSPGPA